MRNTRLSDKIKIVNAVVPSAGAAGAMTAIAVDGTGYDRVMFVLTTGAATSGGTGTFKITSSAATGGTYTDVSGAALTNLADTDGSKQFVIDMPVAAAKPFFKVAGTTVTQPIANSTIAILYRGKTYPVATSYAGEAVVI
jgi:hypothetical protein